MSKKQFVTNINNVATDGDGNISIQLGGGIIEVTYAELVNLKNTSSLVKGQNYLLTDYMTTYEQPDTGLIKSSDIVEPLIITAVSENQISNVCRSTLYPQDIVYYEITGILPNQDYLTTDETEGFIKGKIYRRIDTQKNNDIGTDWRHVKYDRDGVDKLLFENYDNVYNNKMETYFLFNNVVGNNFNSNKIGNYFQENTIGDSFQRNIIGNSFSINTIGDGFTINMIGNTFQRNTIGNTFQSNKIENIFQRNIIGDTFQRNTTGVEFTYNGNQTTPFLSQNTEFRNNISYVTSSTQIQNVNIDVVVFKSPDGTKKQRYYDDSNNLVINNL